MRFFGRLARLLFGKTTRPRSQPRRNEFDPKYPRADHLPDRGILAYPLPNKSTGDTPAVPSHAPASFTPTETIMRGQCWVVDGDTIVINKMHIRLAGIDAPELDHPWGNQSKWALVKLCKGQVITAHIKPELSYDRVVAECFLPDGRDLAAEVVKAGMALDWPKFSGGKYRHLETEDARRKLWRASARQRGKMPS